ncbi:MAG: AbrB/MazE/SpoVT family DNA-binding domain-containing protein [Candidatus Odinarchaeum yellowstonii]|uniref:AbrB/MazE/SpoVT family DNA-binding domain-containing protein n=1 Tax=Odinarchaeota yellowstonii (strain LCB_4) TaxID=1841599 RepID=A0AAF0IDM5_ODILC|nr:MAG: AbrB/MazE/SpoVT family DNA-binding domain-containing protein [Candidatus Odinarchaeum yellowstonii]
MEVRKIQKTGGSTYLISLPKDWITRLGLKQGDHLALIEKKDGTITLDPRYDEKEVHREAVITPNSNIAIDITAKYLSGYDIIKIKSPNRISSELRDTIIKTKERLIGVEIVEESANEIILNCLISPDIVPIDKTLRRIHLLTLRMHEEAIKSFIEKDFELAKNVIERDDEVDKLYFLFVREIRSALQDPKVADKIGLTPIKCLDYRMVVKSLENIGDAAVKIASITLELTNNELTNAMRQYIIDLSQHISELQDKAMQALLKEDVFLAINVMDKRKTLAELIEKVNNELMKEESSIRVKIDSILDGIERISDYAVDIAEFVIRH